MTLSTVDSSALSVLANQTAPSPPVDRPSAAVPAASADKPAAGPTATPTSIAMGSVGLNTFVAVVSTDSSRVLYTIPDGYRSALPVSGNVPRLVNKVAT